MRFIFELAQLQQSATEIKQMLDQKIFKIGVLKRAMSKNKIIVLSDIHIGDNSPTVWYQKSFHEPYLTAVLDHVIKNASSIQELILLGDIFDFWTYPPDKRPPSFEQIIEQNPNILGPQGKLSQVLTALEGQVTYVRGNHDMNVTQEDLNKIQNPDYTIKLSPSDIYFPLGEDNKKIVCTHGHLYAMFNAPDTSVKFNPLPVGHFVSRAAAYELQQTLPPGKTVADLTGQTSPNGIDLKSLAKTIMGAQSGFSVTDLLLNYITQASKMPEIQPIILPDGQTTTIAEVKPLYSQLWQQWINNNGGARDGLLVAIKAALADAKDYYMGWFAQKLALECGADLVVMGHTHTPISGLKKGLIQYVNSGFECPSKPDIGKQHVNFIEIDTDSYQGAIFKVVNQQGSYQIEADSAEQTSVIIPGLSQDYSCYITVENQSSISLIQRVSYEANQGHYIVAPTQSIGPREKGRFWIQDYPGITKGSEGQVIYFTGDREITLRYSCPVGLSPNSCSGAEFYTSVDGINWGERNQIVNKGLGHPFFVRFVL
ncbi:MULTISPECIES: metallophosphoesterase [unclassified Microcystis]|uniref:metallophosphoesterase n=1 Tax=unclassified Microcystis TaxID=2643300 RepID=UPI0025802223|nr:MULTISPECIES: metallophosphoesterase [unclassified Microcystis]